MKASKLKVRINMDNDWMYIVYWNRGQGFITLGVMSLGRFSKKLKCNLLNNFYVCGPTSMKLVPHLVSEVRKVEWQNGGQGPITLGIMSLLWFSNFAILENFPNRFPGTMKARKLKVCINMDNDWMYCVYRYRGQGSKTLRIISLCRFSITCLWSYFSETYTTLGL